MRARRLSAVGDESERESKARARGKRAKIMKTSYVGELGAHGTLRSDSSNQASQGN
jgi:hypothetical protein